MRKILALIATALYLSPCYSAEPEFYINYLSCSNTVGYLVLSDDSLKTMPGDTTIMACSRKGDAVSCTFTFQNGDVGHNGNEVSYKILIDSPPHLHFATPNGSEYVAIDTSQHAASLISRLIGEKYAGSKVCNGLYATDFEMKNLNK